ncbi:MAG: tetratricopeptide repeat protein [Myxococcales bacterium]|nr:tetratricopeptide repeat protein [Myxococcales bacterium]
MRAHRVLGWVVLAAACRPASTTEPSPRTEAAEAAEAADDQGPTLEEIADAIDPGPRAALTVDMPAWLADGLGVAGMSGDPATLLAEARAELDRFEALSKAAGGDAGLPGVVALARALALAERAGGTVERAPVEVLLVLEKVYRMIDLPALADDHNVFGQMISVFVTALSKDGKVEESAALEQLVGLVQGALRRSGDLHRRTVASLLRGAPEHPDVPEVLARLGPKIIDEDEALAVGVVRRSLAMRGPAATAAHWLDLAALCHRALDVSCGRQALAEAEARASADDEAVQARLHEGRELAKSAHRAVELRDAAGLDDELDRGQALVHLQRYDEARAVYEQLLRLHPDDARPVVGLARLKLTDGLDFVGAAELIERAAPRDHLDRDWYELAIGVRATMLVYHLLPQIADREPKQIFDALRPSLVQLRSDIEALERLGADEGRVLRFVYDLAMEALPKAMGADAVHTLRELVRELLPRARALHDEVPRSRHAYSLLLSAAEFSPDRELALAVLDVEPPAEHAGALALRRAQAAFDLVVAWDAVERVPDLLALLDGLDGEGAPREVRLAVLDGRVAAKRLGHAGPSWAELEQGYRALLAEPGGEADARLLNNLAVVVAEQGRGEQARALWTRALEAAPEETRDLPALALRVSYLSEAPAGSAAERDGRVALEQLAEAATAAEGRLSARAWLVCTAKGSGRRKARATLAKAAAADAANNYRPRNLSGRGAIIMRGSFQVGLGYSSREGMQLQLDAIGVPWLVMPCPVEIPDPRAR